MGLNSYKVLLTILSASSSFYLKRCKAIQANITAKWLGTIIKAKTKKVVEDLNIFRTHFMWLSCKYNLIGQAPHAFSIHDFKIFSL